MPVAFRRAMDVASKSPDGGMNPLHTVQRARRQGVLSFGYFSFAQAKKSNARRAAAENILTFSPYIQPYGKQDYQSFDDELIKIRYG